MKTLVEFRSSQFPPYENEEDEMNPGIWGKRLAEYLARKLTEHQIETCEMAIEDWGCCLPIRNKGFRLALCCGHESSDDDVFYVFTEPATPIVKKLFRTIDASTQLTQLIGVLHQILEADDEIHDVHWYEP